MENDERKNAIEQMLKRASDVKDRNKPVELTLNTFLLILEELMYLRNDIDQSSSSLLNYITEVDHKLDETCTEFSNVDKAADKLRF